MPCVSVYKRRGSFLYPFTCAWAVRVVPTATLSRVEEGSQRRKTIKATPRQRCKEKEGEVDSPSKTLARGQASRGGGHQDLPGGGLTRLAPEEWRYLCKGRLARFT